jgi:hypothetical protein
MDSTIPQPPGGIPADWMRAAVADSALTDSLMDHLESRVSALEEITAARWPVRVVAAFRLGRKIRRSADAFAWAGPGFEARRLEATTNQWLSSR